MYWHPEQNTTTAKSDTKLQSIPINILWAGFYDVVEMSIEIAVWGRPFDTWHECAPHGFSVIRVLSLLRTISIINGTLLRVRSWKKVIKHRHWNGTPKYEKQKKKRNIINWMYLYFKLKFAEFNKNTFLFKWISMEMADWDWGRREFNSLGCIYFNRIDLKESQWTKFTGNYRETA